MSTARIHRSLSALAFAVAVLGPLTVSAQSPDTVLLSNSVAKVTLAEYQRELLKLPPDLREAFPNDPKRVNDLLVRLLMQKSLAARAKAAKLDTRPDNAARLQLELDRLLAAFEIDAIESAAAAEFNANIARYETRAREMYLVDKSSFATPAQVSATHILFDTKKRSPEEAKRLATETRAKIAAGADMAKLAKELSDDPASGQNGGALGWFSQKDMDPTFAAATFALAKPGDLSEPVLSKYGWHVIRLDDKRPPATKSYEEAREIIMSDLQRRFIEEKRAAAIMAIRSDPKMEINREAVNALTPRVDPDVARRAMEAAHAVPPAASK